MEAQIAAMLVLMAGLIAFKTILAILFERIQRQHTIILNKFNLASKRLLQGNPIRLQFDKDVTILEDHIRNHSHETIIGLLFGVSSLIGYGIFLILDIMVSPIVFTTVIAMSLIPITLITIYYNHKIYTLYKKWPQHLTDPYQWI